MYIEFVIVDNFVLTLLAGSAAARLCHKRVNIWRLIAAAAVGTVVAVFYPFLRSSAAEFAVKLALWCVLSFIMFFKTQKSAVSGVLFLGCTFAFGGASYALGLILYSSASGAAEFCGKYPLCLTLGTGAAVYIGMRGVAKRLRLKRAREPYDYGAEVEIFGRKLTFEAFLDTGNCVFDPRTGLPVMITDAERFTSKLDATGAGEFVKNIDKFRTMTVETAAGETRIYILKPKSVTVYSDRHGHKIDAMVGLVGGRRFGSAHEMLIGPAAISEAV